MHVAPRPVAQLSCSIEEESVDEILLRYLDLFANAEVAESTAVAVSP